ncbi:hypothetical protein EYF80_064623 [Liparis tanakae]|uniref:Uncharacterized protein n=1 Tax=Liparis tanakae TaxID=230148 RepID=A0A4Z2E9K3_9TELE|nr:hypothetical protein EYF80_064623 [Liparis tanakae]
MITTISVLCSPQRVIMQQLCKHEALSGAASLRRDAAPPSGGRTEPIKGRRSLQLEAWEEDAPP